MTPEEVELRRELRQLKRKLARVEEEHAILAKAAAWFAKETIKIPDRSSSSSRCLRPNFALQPCATCGAFPAAGITLGGDADRRAGRTRIANCYLACNRFMRTLMAARECIAFEPHYGDAGSG